MDLSEHFFCDDCGVVVIYEVLGQLSFVLPDVAGQEVRGIRLLSEYIPAVFLIVQNTPYRVGAPLLHAGRRRNFFFFQPFFDSA